MDASEFEADVFLYKASAELLSELQGKIPRLLKNSKTGRYRQWVLASKVWEIENLLDRFQEWPQLLDPYLANLIQILVDSLLFYATNHRDQYRQDHSQADEVIPLPRAVCSILYSFCKVRGQKVIIRLLNNEPRYVEPLLRCFSIWNDRSTSGQLLGPPMIWQEQYILLLWLSHLMLAPFELASISIYSAPREIQAEHSLFDGLPAVAETLLEVGLDHAFTSSKAREAASTLIVRLSLRADMQKIGLPRKIVAWALSQLQTEDLASSKSSYHYIGLLSLLFGMSNSASDSESASFVFPLFQSLHSLVSEPAKRNLLITDSAPARKFIIKSLRATIIHIRSLGGKFQLEGIDVDGLLEDCIQTLLEFLADKDTPVRQAAAKALSIICLSLEPEMTAEVVEAVLGSLNENILLEDSATGRLVPATDHSRDISTEMKKNVTVVDHLQWHGAMLALGHLLFRRSPPITMLDSVIEALLIGLEFEQRSNAGTSIGVGVRDAACFGIWSLSRKYSTAELRKVPVTTSMAPDGRNKRVYQANDMIQVIATQLILSACLDPSGNMRRGSSAALQELIGRHPDVIEQGIALVQTVDYHAVARRSRAVTEVALAAAKLGQIYHEALLHASLRWRGARATDAESRRDAAACMKLLAALVSDDELLYYTQKLTLDLTRLAPRNVGSTAAARHGLLLATASLVDVVSQRDSFLVLADLNQIAPGLLQSPNAFAGLFGERTSLDFEFVYEGLCAFISAAANLVSNLARFQVAKWSQGNAKSWLKAASSLVDHCTITGEKDITIEAAVKANIALIPLMTDDDVKLLLSSWLSASQQKSSDMMCKGRLLTMGMLNQHLAASRPELLTPEILSFLCGVIEGNARIEIKTNAMQAMELMLLKTERLTSAQLDRCMHVICLGLSDYTIDRRGDIGSLLRLQSIQTSEALISCLPDDLDILLIIQNLVKLAGEKLNKFRFRSWTCLKSFDLIGAVTSPKKREKAPTRTLSGHSSQDMEVLHHQADVTTSRYFRGLIALATASHNYEHLLLGLMSSIAAGSEDTAKFASEALVASILDVPSSERQDHVQYMTTVLIKYIDVHHGADDREVVPAVDFLAFILGQIVPLGHAPLSLPSLKQLWLTSQKTHAPGSTLIKLESMIRLYSAMLSIEGLRENALDRLSRLLLHKWPKVRSNAADALFIFKPASLMLMLDWNAPVSTNKAFVLRLRKDLGVAGKA